MQLQALHHKAFACCYSVFSVEYDMCSCFLLFYIASIQPSCCSDERFEDFRGEFDEF
jgi:hypothetical protein